MKPLCMTLLMMMMIMTMHLVGVFVLCNDPRWHSTWQAELCAFSLFPFFTNKMMEGAGAGVVLQIFDEL